MLRALQLTLVITTLCAPVVAQSESRPGPRIGPTPSGAQGSVTAVTCPTANPCPTFAEPGGLAWDGAYIWVGSYDDTVLTIDKIDPASCQVVLSIPAPGVFIGGLAWDGSALWAAAEQEGLIYRLDPSNGDVLHSIPAPGFGRSDPDSVGLAWDGEFLWQCDNTDNLIYRLDPADGSILSSIPTPGTWAGGLAYRDGVLINYDVDAASNFVLDAATGNVISSCTVPVAHHWGLAVDNFGDILTAFYFGDLIYVQDADLNVFETYCTSNPNSTGAEALISASGSASSSDGALTLSSAPVPNQSGIFFHGANQISIPFGCGLLCTSGSIVRGNVVLSASNVGTYTYDNSNAKHSLAGVIGMTRNFQHWYRDPFNFGSCGNTFNTSNAVVVHVLP